MPGFTGAGGMYHSYGCRHGKSKKDRRTVPLSFLSPTPEVLKPSPGLGDKNNQAPYLSRRSAFANSTVIRCRLSKNPSPPILH